MTLAIILLAAGAASLALSLKRSWLLFAIGWVLLAAGFMVAVVEVSSR